MSPTSILKLNSTAYTPSTDNGTRTHNLDDISVLLSPLSYIGVLVAGEGLEPPSSAYETELETTSSLTRYVVVIKGLEPLTGGDPIRLMRPTLHLHHNVCGMGMESNHRHKSFRAPCSTY